MFYDKRTQRKIQLLNLLIALLILIPIPKWAGRIDFSDLHSQTGLIAIKPHRNDPKSQSLVRQYSLPSGIDDPRSTEHKLRNTDWAFFHRPHLYDY